MPNAALSEAMAAQCSFRWQKGPRTLKLRAKSVQKLHSVALASKKAAFRAPSLQESCTQPTEPPFAVELSVETRVPDGRY
ncbi:MAG: hypothetical protein ACI9VR_001149 [Cognaticolwellia sp.]